MQRLLVSGLGFHPEKVLRPAAQCDVAGVLIVYGDHERSVQAEQEVRRSLSDLWLRAVRVPDWDLRALNEALREAAAGAESAMGGSSRVRMLVNMTAGHGFLHACLARLADGGGHEMVYWREDHDECVHASPYVVGTAKLPSRPRQVLEALHKRPRATAPVIARDVGLASSSAYAALTVLRRAGLVQRNHEGMELTCHGAEALRRTRS